MRITDIANVVPSVKEYRKIVNLTSRIEYMRDYHRKHSAKDYGHIHNARATEVLECLKKGGGKIISSLSRVDDIIDIPTKQILEWIFHGLRQPTAKQQTEYAAKQLELLEEMSRTQRAATQKFLLGCEIALKARQEWYMVFQTLTVRNGDYYKVFNQNSTAFQDYIRRVDRTVVRTSERKKHPGIEREMHKYFAVVEEGAKNGRLHIHILHFFKRLPQGAYDPNYGRQKPTETLLYCLRSLWPHGTSEPKIVRYSPIDAWGKRGYRWPLDYETGEPFETGTPLRIASYMSKYITKSQSSKKRSQLLWRVRKTKRLGKELLEELLKNLTTPTLMMIATTGTISAKLNNWKIPPILLRQEAIRIIHLQKRNLSSTTKDLYTNTLETIAKELQPLQPFGQSPQGLTQMIQENNHSNTGFMKMVDLDNEETYEEARQEFIAAATSIREKYFPTSFIKKGSYPTTAPI